MYITLMNTNGFSLYSKRWKQLIFCNQDISIYTGGVFNGEKFITQRTEVSVNAAGEAYVNATEYAEIRIKAGGDVFIYGNPKEVDESRVLGGRIKRM